MIDYYNIGLANSNSPYALMNRQAAKPMKDYFVQYNDGIIKIARAFNRHELALSLVDDGHRHFYILPKL